MNWKTIRAIITALIAYAFMSFFVKEPEWFAYVIAAVAGLSNYLDVPMRGHY